MAKLTYIVRCALPTFSLGSATDEVGLVSCTTAYQLSGSRKKLLKLASFMADEQDKHCCPLSGHPDESGELEQPSVRKLLAGDTITCHSYHCGAPQQVYHVVTSLKVTTKQGKRVLFACTMEAPATELLAQLRGNLEQLAEAGQADSENYRLYLAQYQQLWREVASLRRGIASHG
jgi:hypothetical protein